MTSESILVVDDEESNRDFLSRRLRRQGYCVDTAPDGERALEMIDRKVFDLVLLDVMMPGLSGFEVLEEIRRSHSSVLLPVIMVTAVSDSDSTIRALDRGANDYVTKPLEFPVALARIRNHLRARDVIQHEQPTFELEPTMRALSPEDFREALAQRVKTGVQFDASKSLVGETLVDKYRLDASIGKGAFGAVYRATHLALQKEYAIKVLLISMKTSERHIARFHREALACCALDHPHAVRVFDIDVTPAGVPFLVMELLVGRTIGHELVRWGKFSPERSVEILLPICDLLAKAHRLGIVHRDLKPSNVFLHEEHGSEVVKVVDFGLAKIVAGAEESDLREDLTKEGHLPGTPAFIAPERWLGEAYSSKADVYSLGVLLYIMLTGEYPFGGTENSIDMAVKAIEHTPIPLREQDPEIDVELDGVVTSALAKDPRRRPTAAELARAYAAACDVEIDPRALPHLAV